MIRAKFLIGDHRLTGFEISGHAMVAQAGEDPVCAAVSSAAYMAANTVTDVIGANAEARVSGSCLTLDLKEADPQCETVLQGLRLHLTALSEQYPENIKVIYGGAKHA